MNVGILTMFNGLESIYSIVNVVADHIEMLLSQNIQVRLLVSEDLNMEERYGIFLDQRIEWVKVCNHYEGKQIQWRDYHAPQIPIHSTFYDEADTISRDLVKKLQGLDVCILHDILYQGWHLIHNVALRSAAKELPNLRFIAMTHSLPDESQLGKVVPWPHSARYSDLANTTFVYPTNCGIPSMARQYNIPLSRCKVLSNTFHGISNLCTEVKDINQKTKFTEADILIVYPARLTTGKRLEKVAMFAGSLKRVSSYQINVIFCEFASMDTDAKDYKKKIIEKGTSFGLDAKDMIFTSELGYPFGLPRQAILDLFTLSNLYICPSFSESFGLTVLEAASRGNYLVLNEAIPALEELGKELGAYFLRWDARNFGFNTEENYYPDEESYYLEHGRKIIYEMEHNSILSSKTKSRKKYSPNWVFENQMKKLLE